MLPSLSKREATLIKGLWDCMVEAGADVSDFDGWEHWARMYVATDLAEDAVNAVKELRASYIEEGEG